MKELVNYIKYWGDSASIALLDGDHHLFQHPSVEGVIGYKRYKHCAVVLGEPICPVSHKELLAKEFHSYCEKEGLEILYITVSPTFKVWAESFGYRTFLETGKEFFVDPHYDPTQGSKGRVLRRKLSHMQKEAIVVQEYTKKDPNIEKAMQHVAEQWLKGRKGPQIYVAEVDLFNGDSAKRWFYAAKGDELLGVVILYQLDSRSGWIVHLLMTVPEAPCGVSERLIISVMEKLREEGCSYLSFGTVQRETLGEIEGLSWLKSCMARGLFKLANRLFSLDGRRTFWEKFQPQEEKLYMMCSSSIRYKELSAMKKAMHVSMKNVHK